MVVHPLLILVAFAVVLAAALVVRAIAARAGKHTEPACGQCGYSTTGLTTQICPECGGDLRVVGISVSGWRPAGPARTLVWGLAIAGAFVLGWIQWAIVAEHLPPELRRSEQRTLTGPASGAYRQILMNAGSAGWARQPLHLDVELSITLSNGQTGAPLDLRVGQTTREQKTGAPFSMGLLKGWLASNGVTMEETDPELADVAMAVLQATAPREYDAYGSHSASGSRSGGSFAMERYSMRTAVTRSNAVTLSVQVVWIVAYVAGIIWALRGLRGSDAVAAH